MSTKKEIKNKLNSMVHSAIYSKYLQDSIVTIKNEARKLNVPNKEKQEEIIILNNYFS